MYSEKPHLTDSCFVSIGGDCIMKHPEPYLHAGDMVLLGPDDPAGDVRALVRLKPLAEHRGVARQNLLSYKEKLFSENDCSLARASETSKIPLFDFKRCITSLGDDNHGDSTALLQVRRLR